MGHIATSNLWYVGPVWTLNVIVTVPGGDIQQVRGEVFGPQEKGLHLVVGDMVTAKAKGGHSQYRLQFSLHSLLNLTSLCPEGRVQEGRCMANA